ncbi:hypothetical protein DFH08DRAFT_1084771 [Mycena albidolilacea]|uniref:Uncharacterized protein n=1 Tax=Mycena albidolilacea TaxID=1033008 RepID=A0AAD6ZKL4_9AGAR|nr:hypothetical protein DFH08DRAFT_1084771 [Mycena albidolilacea]
MARSTDSFIPSMYSQTGTTTTYTLPAATPPELKALDLYLPLSALPKNNESEHDPMDREALENPGDGKELSMKELGRLKSKKAVAKVTGPAGEGEEEELEERRTNVHAANTRTFTSTTTGTYSTPAGTQLVRTRPPPPAGLPALAPCLRPQHRHPLDWLAEHRLTALESLQAELVVPSSARRKHGLWRPPLTTTTSTGPECRHITSG